MGCYLTLSSEILMKNKSQVNFFALVGVNFFTSSFGRPVPVSAYFLAPFLFFK